MLSRNSLFYLRTVLPLNTRKNGVWIFFFQILTKNANRAFTALFHICPCWDCTLFHSLFLVCYHGIGNTMSEQSPQWVWGKLESEFLIKTLTALPHSSTSKSTVNAQCVQRTHWALKAVDVWILPLIRTHNKKRSLIFFFFVVQKVQHSHFFFPS